MLKRLLAVSGLLSALAVPVLSAAGAPAPSPVQERADHFLALVNAGYQALYRVQQ